MLSCLLAAGCREDDGGGTPSSELPVVRFCTSGGVGLPVQPLLYAQSFGLLDLYEVLIERVDFADAETAFAALGAGDCEFLLSDAALGFVEIARGADFRMIASPAPWRATTLVATPEVTRLADLAGRRVGVEQLGGADHLATVDALRGAGVDPEGVEFVPATRLGPGAGVEPRYIDAAALPVLWAARAIQGNPDLHFLDDMAMSPAGRPLDAAIFATGASIADKRGVSLAVVEALIDAGRSLADDADGAVESAVEFGLDGDVAAAAYDRVYGASEPFFAVNGGLDRPAVAATLRSLEHTGRLAPSIDVDDVMEPRFVVRALDDLGPVDGPEPEAAPAPCGEQECREEVLALAATDRLEWWDLAPGGASRSLIASAPSMTAFSFTRQATLTGTGDAGAQPPSSGPNPERIGTRVRIAGFVLPAGRPGHDAPGSVLVPYKGECVHVPSCLPPPAANQMIHLPHLDGDAVRWPSSPVLVQGTLDATATDWGGIAVDYRIEDAEVQPFVQ